LTPASIGLLESRRQAVFVLPTNQLFPKPNTEAQSIASSGKADFTQRRAAGASQ
jgi:hypothetical protein